MSLVSIFTGTKRDKLGPVTITCAVRETHTRTADVAEHPLEVGTDVSDHRTVKPDELSIDGIISDAITDIVDDIINAPDADIGRFSPVGKSQVQEAYEKLMDMFDKSDVFTAVTSLKLYKNMVFTRFMVTRDKDTGTILSFSATLKQVTFVSSQNIDVHVLPKAAAGKDVGKKSAGAAGTPVPKVGDGSVALDGVTAIAGSAAHLVEMIP